MTGPAHVIDLHRDDLEDGGRYQPVCNGHDDEHYIWMGAASNDRATAELNARVHNTDRHPDAQPGLFDLEER